MEEIASLPLVDRNDNTLVYRSSSHPVWMSNAKKRRCEKLNLPVYQLTGLPIKYKSFQLSVFGFQKNN